MTSDKIPAATTREQILEEHRKIAELTGTIAKTRDLKELQSGLKQLLPLLEVHFEREEGQDGLHGSIKAQAPQQVAAIEGLIADHRALIQHVEQLREQVQSCLDGPMKRIRKDCKKLFQDLQAHEARENDVFLDTVWTDLGTGD